jgi:hypothetical protein
MVRYPRFILHVTAAASIAAQLCAAAPAVAAESAVVPASEAAMASAKAAPKLIRRHASRGIRIAASSHDRRAGVTGGSLDCSGVWCGRQFVLMIGIGY